MIEQRRKLMIERLRKLADEIEQGKSNVAELSFEKHYKPCLIVEKNLYKHDFTGDNMVTIRIKNNMYDSISVSDLESAILNGTSNIKNPKGLLNSNS